MHHNGDTRTLDARRLALLISEGISGYRDDLYALEDTCKALCLPCQGGNTR